MRHLNRAIAVSTLALLFLAPQAVRAQDSPAWAQLRADALAAARAEREHPDPLRPPELRNANLAADVTEIADTALWNLGDPDVSIVKSANRVLAYLGDKALPQLRRGMHSKNPKVQTECAALLGTRGDAGADALAEALKDKTGTHRSEFAHALAHTGAPHALPVLIELVSDGDGSVQEAAFESLMTYHDAKSYDVLFQRMMTSQDANWIWTAATYLHEFDSTRAKDGLARVAARTDLPASNQQFGGRPLPEFLTFLVGRPSEIDTDPTRRNQWPLVQIAYDAQTYAGENYGPKEIDALRRGIVPGEQDVYRGECLNALCHLHVYDFPGINLKIATTADLAQFSLVQFPIDPMVQAFADHLNHPGNMNDRWIEALADAPRWALPFFVTLASRPDMIGASTGPESHFPSTPPPARLLFQAFNKWLTQRGAIMKSPTAPPQPDPPGREEADQAAQAALLLKWWHGHGSDYLAGRDVALPTLQYIVPQSRGILRGRAPVPARGGRAAGASATMPTPVPVPVTD